MERKERFQIAFNHLRMKGVLKSQKDLAKALCATAPHISSALKGDKKYLTDNLLMRFQSKFHEFNLKWLIDGVGEMLVRDNQELQTSEPAQIPNIGEEIKDLDEAIRLSQKGLTNQEQMDQVLSMYSACIRRFDDDHARINEELKELSLARQTLNKEIEEVRSLKAALHDAIFMLRTSTQQESNHKPLMASDNDNNI